MEGGDKLVTNSGPASPPNPSALTDPPPTRRKGKRGKPVATIKFGSASVPIYRSKSGGRTRFTIAFHREGKRERKVFSTLDAA
jgi:hypothetical protein